MKNTLKTQFKTDVGTFIFKEYDPNTDEFRGEIIGHLFKSIVPTDILGSEATPELLFYFLESNGYSLGEEFFTLVRTFEGTEYVFRDPVFIKIKDN